MTTDEAALKGRGFFMGGRIGSWIGLIGSAIGTAYAFYLSGADGWTSHHWLALCLAGPMLVAGGWIAGRFAGAYVGELAFSRRREQAGFVIGGVLGAVLADFPWDRRGVWLVGLAIGAGIGRSLAAKALRR